MKFYTNNDLSTIVETVEGNAPSGLSELIPNSTEAAVEKHTPVVSVSGNTVSVNVGSVSHPMEAAHNIAWVEITTTNGVQRKYLKAGSAPVVNFILTDDEKLQEAFAYCNLHGLWKVQG